VTLKTDFPDAYVGRAAAAARLGDEKRMNADLAVFKKGGWFSTRTARSAVEDELGFESTASSLLNIYFAFMFGSQRANMLSSVSWQITK